MDNFFLITLSIIQSLKFTPLVLIGLMITSLSLILNIKDNNIYLSAYKKHNNIKKFVKNIYSTIVLLIAIFLISIISNYLCLISITEISDYEYIQLSLITVLFFILILWIIRNILSISFIIKEIVISSLQEDEDF